MAIVITDDKHYKAIGETLRFYVGGQFFRPEEMPSAIGQVQQSAWFDGHYNGVEEGTQTERLEVWNGITQNNTRANYREAFFKWHSEYIKPPYTVMPTDVNSGNQTFASAQVKRIEKNSFDFSQKTKGTTNNQQGWYVTFSNCKMLEVLEDIGMQAEFAYTNTFAWCNRLHTIEVLRTDENTKWGAVFNGCAALRNMTIAGTIGQNGFNVQDCSLLSHDSLMSIINALQDKTTDTSGTVWEVVMGSTNKAKLTAEELAIAEGKGWAVT